MCIYHKSYSRVLLFSLFCFTFLVCEINAQNEIVDEIAQIESVKSKEQRQQLAEDFYQKMSAKELPFIQEDHCIFLYKGIANYVHIAGDMNGWTPNKTKLNNIKNTDIWYYQTAYPKKTRLEYKFIINKEDWILDPENKNTTAGHEFVNSILEYPDYPKPKWEIVMKDVPQGMLLDFKIESEIMDTSYSYTLYLPADYEEKNKDKFGLAVFHDGKNNLEIARTNIILDNLIYSGKMKPILGVFLNHNRRNDEYALADKDKFADFVVKELIPQIKNLYRVSSRPSNVASIGQSFGGNISAIIAFNNPDIVGLCGSHSGAYWPNDQSTVKLIREKKNEEVKYAAVWGKFESLHSYNKTLANELTEAGRSVYQNHYPEGHNWTLWTHSYHEILQFLFPAE